MTTYRLTCPELLPEVEGQQLRTLKHEYFEESQVSDSANVACR